MLYLNTTDLFSFISHRVYINPIFLPIYSIEKELPKPRRKEAVNMISEMITPVVFSEYIMNEEEKKKENEKKKREKKEQMKSLFGDTVAYYTASSSALEKNYITYGKNRQYIKI